MNKRGPYVPPRLAVVQLNHTQAVPSQCSIVATTLLRNVLEECAPDPHLCRQDETGHGGDYGGDFGAVS